MLPIEAIGPSHFKRPIVPALTRGGAVMAVLAFGAFYLARRDRPPFPRPLVSAHTPLLAIRPRRVSTACTRPVTASLISQATSVAAKPSSPISSRPEHGEETRGAPTRCDALRPSPEGKRTGADLAEDVLLAKTFDIVSAARTDAWACVPARGHHTR